MTIDEITTEQGAANGGSAAGAVAAEGTGTAPVACSLSRAGLAAQAARWVRLAARAMTERARTEDGLRIWFRPEPGAEEELRTLVATETECCPWATWTVRADPGRVVLDVRSSGDGVTALHGMFAGLRPEAAVPPAGNAPERGNDLPD